MNIELHSHPFRGRVRFRVWNISEHHYDTDPMSKFEAELFLSEVHQLSSSEIHRMIGEAVSIERSWKRYQGKRS